MVLDDEIYNLKEESPDFVDFPFLDVASCLLDGPVKGVMLFDVEAVFFNI